MQYGAGIPVEVWADTILKRTLNSSNSHFPLLPSKDAIFVILLLCGMNAKLLISRMHQSENEDEIANPLTDTFAINMSMQSLDFSSSNCGVYLTYCFPVEVINKHTKRSYRSVQWSRVSLIDMNGNLKFKQMMLCLGKEQYIILIQRFSEFNIKCTTNIISHSDLTYIVKLDLTDIPVMLPQITLYYSNILTYTVLQNDIMKLSSSIMGNIMHDMEVMASNDISNGSNELSKYLKNLKSEPFKPSRKSQISSTNLLRFRYSQLTPPDFSKIFNNQSVNPDVNIMSYIIDHEIMDTNIGIMSQFLSSDIRYNVGMYLYLKFKSNYTDISLLDYLNIKGLKRLYEDCYKIYKSILIRLRYNLFLNVDNAVIVGERLHILNNEEHYLTWLNDNLLIVKYDYKHQN